jgi:membrane fusion protein (multidrug efflux system)
LSVGSVVDEGEILGRLIPHGTLRVVAEFRPADALGRIRPGQAGRMRLEGFPWTEYGSLPVRVTGVAAETRSDQVRVELGVEGRPSHAPLQHGLPGRVEVEIERVSPIALLLRGAGRWLDEPRLAEGRPGPAP